MLNFLNLKKKKYSCELCGGHIKGKNCTPKGCSHFFHTVCFDEWVDTCGECVEYACPVSECSTKFTEICVRNTPGSSSTTLLLIKESYQCSICCETIQKPIATPESCNHSFCYLCLREWARVRHECPLDRGHFELILLSERIGGPIIKRVPAPPVKQQPSDTPPLEIDVNCNICNSPEDEAHLLLCDHCDRGFHTYCLPNPLSSVPEGDWYCPQCVDAGIPAPTTTNIRRSTRRRIADSEAEESDRINNDTTPEDSSLENHNSRELSVREQRSCELRAARRHRGARLLQDLINQLSERIASEASLRAIRRRSQRQRVRNQLASESVMSTTGNSNSDSPQTTLRFEISSTESQPVSLRLTRSTAQTNANRPSRSCTNRTESFRPAHKRRRLLSITSDSDSDDELPSSTTGVRSVRRKKTTQLLDDSDIDEPLPVPGPSTVHNDGNSTSSTLDSASFNHDNVSSVANNFSLAESESPSALEDSSFVLPSRKRKSLKRKSVKRRTVRSKTKRKPLRKLLRSSKRSKKRSARRKKVVRTARMSAHKKSILSSSSSSSSSRTRALGQNNLKPCLPRLSILGNEVSCDFQMLVGNDDSELGLCNQVPVTMAQVPASCSNSSTYLRDLESSQASMFQFTSRNMQVNPHDHSMSPVPIGKWPVEKSNLKNKSTNGSNYPSTSTSNIPEATHSHNIMNSIGASKVDAVGCSVSEQVLHNGITAYQVSDKDDVDEILRLNPELGWTEVNIEHTKKLLKTHLKTYLIARTIGKDVYRDIYKRCLVKVLRKPMCKVTDARVTKLVDDYVQYRLRHIT